MSRYLFPAICLAAFALGCSRQEQEEPRGTASFEVILTESGDSTITTIKAVREVTGLGLRDAKDLVDNAPGTVREGVSKQEAERIGILLREAGASVDVRPN